MNWFDFVINDKEIIDIYNKIRVYEDENKGWAYHDLNHVGNVAKMVEKILTDLKYDMDFIQEAKVAAILHDTGCINGKDGHAIRGYEFAKKYIKQNNIVLKNEDMVLEAIKIHSDGFDTDNIIALALILSDKLDIKHTRITNEGRNIKGNRQFKHMKDVLINIYDDSIKFEFICDDMVDKKELEEYYFVKKVFNAIRAFSKKVNRKPEVLFNGKRWEIFYEQEK